MHQKLKFFLGFFVLSASASLSMAAISSPEASTKPLHVLVDPGHGGADQGATRGSVKESKISMQVAEQLQKMLEADPAFQVSLTRTSDKFVSLKNRVELIEKNKADLFLSIHANSSTDRRAKGVEFYFQNHLPADEETLFLAANENRMESEKRTEDNASAENRMADLNDQPTKKNDVLAILEDLKRQTRMTSSLKLSDRLLSAWSKSTPHKHFDSNVIRQAPFYVVAKATVPSVLVELGFITNPKEAERLVDAQYQKSVAERIYQGLRDYKEMMDKTQGGTLKSSP